MVSLISPHLTLCSWDLVWDFYCLEITCGSKVRGSLTNPAIPFPDRITTALHTPARKVGGFKSLQVVAVVCCSVLRVLGLFVLLAGWDFFFVAVFFLKFHWRPILISFRRQWRSFIGTMTIYMFFICRSPVSERQCHYELWIDILFLLEVVTNIIFIL